MFGADFIRGLLTESVNDGKLRKNLLDAGGFCSRHAWKAATLGDHLGMAILYESLLDDQLRKLGKRRWVPLRSRECPACSHENEVERAYAAQFIRWWSGSDLFRNTFREKGGLCLRHADMVLYRGMPSETRLELLRAFRPKSAACLEELRAFLRKQNYDRAESPTDAEEWAWLEAVRLVTGDKT
jgi:hypothetical protein